MKKDRLLFALALSLLWSGVLTPAHADEPMTAAVLDFDTAPDVHGPSGADIAGLLSAKLSVSPSIIMVERGDLAKVLGEQELGLSGAEKSPDKVGQLVGAQVLITGRVFNAGSSEYMVAKVMSVETGRVFGDIANFKDEADIPAAIDQIAAKIATILQNHAADLIAKPDSFDEDFRKLKESLQGRKLPSVSVAIQERQIGAPAIDPAAQTAIEHYLQQLGFQVIDPATSDQHADIALTGEAFSELGLRKGNLVSCKGRVEIKVTQRNTGALLFTDAQTSVAFDLGENSTGKAALEKAAAQLLERIVHALPMK